MTLNGHSCPNVQRVVRFALLNSTVKRKKKIMIRRDDL